MPGRQNYVTIKQAAEILGVCCNTLRSWDAAGKIRVYRHPTNNYRLFKLRDLERLRPPAVPAKRPRKQRK